ncbi:FCD domain-containing protein [Plantibacter sp. ME-Dv--P-122b]|uniref:FCD domain-containing protein n=1 Tax=Plantibacter sp. ME-Dv--P-122b TaxID=3040300 RepID=UPI00254BEF5E|nr:FCD domain-containing protein [Plantibacter sp. ME-Dv--P-122b]
MSTDSAASGPRHRRIHLFQTLGALLGGVTRVTVPVLEDADRAALVAELDEVSRVIAVQDPVAYADLSWPLMDHLVALCPNRILVTTARDALAMLSPHLEVTADTDWLDWPSLAVDFPILRDAVAEGDAIAAELAVERLWGMAATLQ